MVDLSFDYSSGGDAENVEPGMSYDEFFRHEFFPHESHYPHLLLSGAQDGKKCIARRLACDVAFNIVNTPVVTVVGSPVMDELRR